VTKIREKSCDSKQSDQIGRIFVFWAIVYFGQFFSNYRSQNFLATFSKVCKRYALIFQKMGWAKFWGDFMHKLIWSP
jgi:hypothetical protein